MSNKIASPAVAAVMLALLAAVAPEDASVRIDFAKGGVGYPPADFEFGRTGEGELGRWTVVRDPTAVDGVAIEHVSTDQHEDRYPIAIYQPLAAENLAVSLRFKLMSGPLLSAGLVLSVRNPESYYAVSASAFEQRVDLLLIRNGRAERIDGAPDVNLAKERWHTLKTTLDDDHFVVSLDGRVLFTTFDRGRRKDGRIGLWTREDNVTRFDQIEIRALPNTRWQ